MTDTKTAPTEPRELTRDERAAIRALVVKMCANYDGHYNICLPLDCACYMLNKWWTGSYCRYFRDAVLPLDPMLEAALTGREALMPDTRPCAACGKSFIQDGKRAYCSPACADNAQRKQKREYIRKKRGGCRKLPV